MTTEQKTLYQVELIDHVHPDSAHRLAAGRTYLRRGLDVPEGFGEQVNVYILSETPRYEGQKPLHIRSWEYAYVIWGS